MTGPSEYVMPPMPMWRVVGCIVAAAVALFAVMFEFGTKDYKPMPPDSWGG